MMAGERKIESYVLVFWVHDKCKYFGLILSGTSSCGPLCHCSWDATLRAYLALAVTRYEVSPHRTPSSCFMVSHE
jgi:hypothetical protein